jgi:hypothetical protein
MANGKPYAGTELAAFLDRRILELKLRKSQCDIAIEAGFPNVNVLSMCRSGVTKVPFDRIPALAQALEVSPRVLLGLVLEQNWGSTWAKAIEQVLEIVVSPDEAVWIRELRDASGNTDPTLTSRLRVQLRALFGR